MAYSAATSNATIVDMTIRVGINGFGRTGRAFTRAALARGLDFEIVAINDLGSPESLARLLARDSVHGPCGFEVKATDGRLQVGTHEIEVFAERHPRDLPWARLGVDVVTSRRASSLPVMAGVSARWPKARRTTTRSATT